MKKFLILFSLFMFHVSVMNTMTYFDEEDGPITCIMGEPERAPACDETMCCALGLIVTGGCVAITYKALVYPQGLPRKLFDLCGAEKRKDKR